MPAVLFVMLLSYFKPVSQPFQIGSKSFDHIQNYVFLKTNSDFLLFQRRGFGVGFDYFC